MLNEIGDYLETNLTTALDDTAYPADGFKLIRQGREDPPSQYPCLFILVGPFAPSYEEMNTDPDMRYVFHLAGTVIGSTYAQTLGRVETQSKRVHQWCVDNDGLGGLTDGTETVHLSEPGVVEPLLQGSGGTWTGYFVVPLTVQTNRT